MKTKSFISFAACVAASVLMCGCSNEESADGNGQLTAFTGGVVTEAPMERVQIGTSESSTEVPGISTRTSMNRDEIGGEGVFLWEPNDVIYVEDDGGKLHKSQNTITDAARRATFLLDGFYTANQYDVYYCGTNSAAGDKKVVIAGNQTQTAFNNTKHFGAAGDCGVAKAEKTTVSGKSGYKFDLEHKASYLCFLPYIVTPEDRDRYKIQSIEITSDNNIAGTYDLTQSGLSGAGDSKTITLRVGTDGLLLADQTVKNVSIENSLYVVIAPGTHALKVKYTVLDTKTNKVMTMIKSYKSHNFAANKICDIPISIYGEALDGGHKNADGSDMLADLYSGHNYYMWDAKENYWSGHEWDSAEPWQPTANGATNDNYPKSKAADGARWHHEGMGYGLLNEFVNPFFEQLPNANEMAWYVLKGDAHWDNSTQWEFFGKIYTGGIWLKKLSVIAKENGRDTGVLKYNEPIDDVDIITYEHVNMTLYNFIPANGKPADSVIGNYFFLPALGYYRDGELSELGIAGYYYSSTINFRTYFQAYSFYFAKDWVSLSDFVSRENGCIAHPFE